MQHRSAGRTSCSQRAIDCCNLKKRQKYFEFLDEPIHNSSKVNIPTNHLASKSGTEHNNHEQRQTRPSVKALARNSTKIIEVVVARQTFEGLYITRKHKPKWLHYNIATKQAVYYSIAPGGIPHNALNSKNTRISTLKDQLYTAEGCFSKMRMPEFWDTKR